MVLGPLVLDQIPGLKFTLERIHDQLFEKTSRLSVKVGDAQSVLDLKHFSGYHHFHYMNLAESYVTLSRCFGPSSENYDPAKSSFCFPFELTVTKAGRNYAYMIAVYDVLGKLEITFFKVLDRPPSSPLGKLVEKEFSCLDMKKFIASFYGYLLGLLEQIPRRRVVPFVRSIPASGVHYGCLSEEFFEEHFPSQAEFEAAHESKLRLLRRQKAAFGALPMRRPGLELTNTGLKLMLKF